MLTLRTTARLTLAALSVGLGATLAQAADKKPIKPAAPPAARVQGHATGKPIQPPTVAKPHAPPIDAKKPNNWSLGASNPTVKPARDLDGQSAGTERTKQPTGQAVSEAGPLWHGWEVTGRTKPANLGDTATHEVGHVKRPRIDPKNAKPISGGGVAALNDAGTRGGAGLALEGVIDVVKGIGQVLSPKGKTHEGMGKIAGGAKKVQTGTNGDPADNGPKLNDEGGSSNGGNNNNGGGSGGRSSGGGGSSGGSTSK